MLSPTLYTSNCIEKLFELLHQELFLPDLPPFSQQWVFIPRRDLKTTYSAKLIDFNADSMLMGIRFEDLSSGIQALYRLFTGKAFSMPSLDILTFHLETLLLKKKDHLPDFFHLSTNQTIARRTLRDLAALLSQTFASYGKFGGKASREWLKQKGWQQELWKEVFSHWQCPSKLLNIDTSSLPHPLTIHLFNFPFIPLLYHRFFTRIAPYVRIIYYQFSPCREFWTDTVSEKTRIFINRRHDERGVSSELREELDRYLQDRHPLLANWGDLHRHSFRFFEESTCQLKEHYVDTSSKTLLEKIQHSILDSKTLKNTECMHDNSIAIYPTTSKLREIEILYENLFKLTRDSDLKLSDIHILAPDITPYAPYIQLIFGASDSPFRFSFVDLPRFSTSSWLQAIMRLLSLSEKRFDMQSIEQFLFHPLVQKKFGLKPQDVSSFLTTMKKYGVKWGFDKKQRADFMGKSPLEEGDTGTWEHGFNKLLKHFAMIPEAPSPWEIPFPDFSQAEKSGICISLLRLLKSDLDKLETAEMSLTEWQTFLDQLVSTYFVIPDSDHNAYRFFQERLNQLRMLEAKLQEATFSGSSMKKWLLALLEEKKGKEISFDLNTLFFGSLNLGISFPSKVTYLLGLEEESFPRLIPPSPLDELKGKGEPNPSSIDQDRALFLELLLSTKRAFYCSYLSTDPTDGKSRPPSSLIQQLLTYLDTNINIEGKKPSQVVIHSHPPFPFHESYFTSSSLRPSFSKRYYRVAKTYLDPSPPIPFIPEFLYPTPRSGEVLPKGILRTTIKELTSLATHPLRFYFNHHLNIYLDYPQLNEEFSLSPLTSALLRRSSFHFPLATVLEQVEEGGRLPLGRFKEIAHLQLAKEWGEAHLKRGEEGDYTVELKEGCFQVEEIEPRHFILPPLVFSLKETTFHIEGVLDSVTSQGFLIHGSKTTSTLLKAWPQFLIFACLDNLPLPKVLIWTQTGKRCTLNHPKHTLTRFLFYYLHALKTPSPCLPKWGDIFLKKGARELAQALELYLRQSKDPYIHWIFEERSHFSTEAMMAAWSPLIKETFQELISL